MDNNELPIHIMNSHKSGADTGRCDPYFKLATTHDDDDDDDDGDDP
jgi:hypothetical protein